MDFANMHNPFDFANPVIDPKLFAGRNSELEEIEYYLNHALSAPRAINLALIGDRASGKTSLLNMIDAGARQRGFCTVRIDLDESDIETQLVFFLKLFDGTLTAACKEGAFGGIHGKTYDAYRSMIDAFDIPDDRTFCPFVFPIQYAKAMNKGNNSVPVSNAYKDDISLIQIELNRPIAILVDECDVLTHSRVHLEKLRNIFMNISGFFLVFTGTGAFFPLINDVFSPIIRQFKKITVKPFNSEKETKDCIEKPLKGLGFTTQNMFDFETYREIEAIHNLSGGRPYEIQLICHQLFKRMQTGKSSKLQLTLDVLDDVLLELQSLQNVNNRPIIQKIRGLSTHELKALNVLLWGNKLITFEQAWYIEYVFKGNKKWTKEQLKDSFENLVSKGMINIEDDLISFSGDDFDRIYCKYYSRKLKALVNVMEMSFEERLRMVIDFFVRQKLTCVKPNTPSFGTAQYIEDAETTIGNFGNQSVAMFDNNPELAEVLYLANLENQDKSTFPFMYLMLGTTWGKINAWYTVKNNEPDCNSMKCLYDFESIFKDIRERALENNSDLVIKVFTVSVVPLDVIADHALLSSNQKFKTNLFRIHANKMLNYYSQEERDIEEVKYHLNLAFQLCPEPEDMQTANNLGYIFMSLGELEKAKSMFELARTRKKTFSFEAPPFFVENYFDDLWSAMFKLVNYNLGIVYAMKGDYDKAKEFISILQIEPENLESHKCSCLFVPQIIDNKLEFVEVFDPDLMVEAKASLGTIDRFIEINNPEIQ
jgi:hypothetical protein